MNDNRELINALTNCVQACEHCATACLTEDNAQKMANCVKTDRDCADICSLAIQFLSRDSKQSPSVIDTCADICTGCATECEKHDHEHCVKCARACRQCEESCRAYLN